MLIWYVVVQQIDPKTKELIGQGFSVTEKPHNAVGVISGTT